MNRWQEKAACRPGTRASELDWWVEFHRPEVALAQCKPVCDRCTVKAACKAAAVETNDVGVIRAGEYLGVIPQGPRKRVDGEPCEDCGIPTRSNLMAAREGLPEGWRHRHAHGLCRGCYEQRRDSGTLPESVKLQDGDPCTGCGKPSRSPRRVWQDGLPEGWVRRECGGKCARCYNAAKKAGVAA